MATTSLITGRVPLPSDDPISYAELTFTLSGLDSEGSDVFLPGISKRVVLVDSEIPAGFDLWRNTEGYRGTNYKVLARWVEATRDGKKDRYAELPEIQVGDEASYTLAELLMHAPYPTPSNSYWMSITQEEYGAALAAADATAADRLQTGLDAAATAADVVLADAAAAAAAVSAENAQASAFTTATWTDLAAITGTANGQGAEVLDSDAGTHTDPVAGGTVNNAGRFTWSVSPAGWKRIGNTGLAGKATAAQGELADSAVQPAEFNALKTDVEEQSVLARIRRGVLARLSGADGRSLIDLMWKRTTGEPRWKGHALSSDVGGFQALPRGVLARLSGADGHSLIDLMWDRQNGIPHWDGHAVNGDVIGAPQVGDAAMLAGASPMAVSRQIATKTEASGIGWAQLSPVATPHIMGTNTSGTSIDMRRGWGLNIIGRRNAGTFTPGAVASVAFQGLFSTSLPDPAGYSAGDYLEQSSAVSNDVDGVTYLRGDLAVLSGGGWVKQASPVAASFNSGDFWTVTGAGIFDGITLAAGDRLLLAHDFTGGGARDRRWAKADRTIGDTCLIGETATPSTSPPASPQNGDLWHVTASNGTYVIGDGLLRQGGAWVRIQGTPVTTVANGASVFLQTQGRADEFEVRRTDKGTTRANVVLSGMSERLVRAPRTGDIWFLGDSMVGFALPALAAQMPTRNIAGDSDGGGTSEKAVDTLTNERRNRGDRYSDRVLIAWHGQNNIADPVQANAANDRIAGWSGAQNPRVLLMSVIGQFRSTFTGGRIVVVNHEWQFTNDTNQQIVQIRNHLRDNHPDAFFDTRAALCAEASSSIPALLHPGLSERDVALTYGIVPFSFFFDLTAVPWSASNLNFIGYYTGAGLPTAAGTNNDYYIRSQVDGGNDIGQLIVRQSGIWVAHNISDITHLRPAAGNAALAVRISETLQNKGW